MKRAAAPDMPATELQEIGRYADDRLCGVTVFIKYARKQEIERFCESVKAGRSGDGRAIRIRFFDSRDRIPDVSAGFSFPAESDRYCVADFSYDPRNNLEELTVHKDIAE